MSRRRPLTPHAEAHLRSVERAFPGVVVTSTWRTRWENWRAGGVKNSYHLRGRAADLVIDRHRRPSLIAFLRADRITPRCTGPEEVINEGDHVHVAW